MNFIENVYEISESFMKNPKYVFMDDDGIKDTAKGMKLDGKIDFIEPSAYNDQFKLAVIELVAASINYCYWYGKHDVRVNNCSSTSMYNTLLHSFDGYLDPSRNTSLSDSIELLCKSLAQERFSLLENRIKHLRELKEDAERIVRLIVDTPENIPHHLTYLITSFPGFASDMFLKRSSLFFIQLYRRFGWFENDLHNFFVPADYQIPKMLEFHWCIKYNDELINIINNNILIPKHSQMECEIRSATILTVKKLCELTKWNVADVDSYFFAKRHVNKEPFHLTITTDY